MRNDDRLTIILWELLIFTQNDEKYKSTEFSCPYFCVITISDDSDMMRSRHKGWQRDTQVDSKHLREASDQL